MITQSGLAQIAGSNSGSSLNDYIRFAKSQQGRSGTNLPDYVLTQKIYENREKNGKSYFYKFNGITSAKALEQMDQDSRALIWKQI